MKTDVIVLLLDEGLAAAYIGKVAICSRGRVGVIIKRKKLPWGWSWIGIGLNTNEEWRWSSRRPSIIAEDVNDYLFRERLLRTVGCQLDVRPV